MAPAKARELIRPTRGLAASLDLVALSHALSARERAHVRGALVGLLRFHRTLARWPTIDRVPAATPIVACYARGALQGCALERGDLRGAERLARAFLAATASVRGELAVEVFYPHRLRWLDDPDTLEIGTEGVALVRRDAGPVLLMPQVARDHGVDGRGMLALLADKARLADDVDLSTHVPAGGWLAAWTVDAVATRLDDTEAASARAAARSGARDVDYAAAWLARMVDARGAVAFAIDARTRVLQPDGELGYARSAIAIEALAAHGGHARTVARARRWLGREIGRAMHGERVAGWPDDRPSVAGTLALACLAGVPAHDRLRALVADGRWRDLAASPAWPWHAGQVAAALGRETPHELWTWCVDSLARQSFAPYVALAARSRGDDAAHRRATAAVATFIRRSPPHVGGASATALPETALTAVAVQALAGAREYRAARAAALAFVRARQLLPDHVPAALDPALALGGFTASPIDDVLRADITGHALLALLA